MDTLLIRITPAGMHPDLGIHVDELPVERLGEELEIGIRAIWLLGAHMMRRFLHLDQRATGSRHIAELRVHDLAELEDHRFVVVVVLVPKHRREGGSADGTEFHRAVRHALRNLPQSGIFQWTAREPLAHYARLIGLLHLPQYLPGAQTVTRHPAARGVAVTADPTEAFDWIKKPGLAAHREVEPAIAVRHDIEPGRLLFGDDG